MIDILKIIILSCQIGGNGFRGTTPNQVLDLQKKCQKELIECVNPKLPIGYENETKLAECLKKVY